MDDFVPCFDYVLIDESQDFAEAFFDLCEKISTRKIYIAGDIFQNVFDNSITGKVTPNFLLNKCYRTDPRTLMFAHAIGLGLFENPVIRWLKDEEWRACGYQINVEKTADGNIYKLTRNPVRRFEDYDDNALESVKIVSVAPENYAVEIIETIKTIKDNNLDLKPDDIGIIFLENHNDNYSMADALARLILKEFHWEVNRGYNSKAKVNNTIFISNKNNVKGLEFPFVICVARTKISRLLRERNSLYMMLTRSFLQTYFFAPIENKELIEKFVLGLKNINDKFSLTVKEPSKAEKEAAQKNIINVSRVNKSFEDLVGEILDGYNFSRIKRKKIYKSICEFFGDEFDDNEDKIIQFINNNERLIND